MMFPLAVFLALSSSQDPPGTIALRQKAVTLVLKADSLTPERKMRLADTLQLRVLVEGSAGLEVELDPLEADEKLWSIQEQATDPAFRPWEKRYTLDPQKPGNLALPVVALRYREGPGKDWHSARWADLGIEVLAPASGGIRGNMPLEPLPDDMPSERRFPWWIIPGSVGGVLILVLAGRWLHRPRATVVLPPGARALRELDRLASAAPAGQPGWFHARASLIIRVYIEERFGLPAPRQTTEEVLLAVSSSGEISAEVQRDVEELLRLCDQVKFAGTQPGVEQKADTLTLARRIVEQSTVKPAA